MIIEEFKTIVIKASEGKFLTNANEVEITERIIATTIALGKFDSADNYKEISAQEAEEYKRLQEEAREIKK